MMPPVSLDLRWARTPCVDLGMLAIARRFHKLASLSLPLAGLSSITTAGVLQLLRAAGAHITTLDLTPDYRFHFSEFEITDFVLGEIAECCASLTDLCLPCGDTLTDAGLAGVVAKCTKLEHLKLRMNHSTGICLNDLTDHGLAEVATSVQLRSPPGCPNSSTSILVNTCSLLGTLHLYSNSFELTCSFTPALPTAARRTRRTGGSPARASPTVALAPAQGTARV